MHPPADIHHRHAQRTTYRRCDRLAVVLPLDHGAWRAVAKAVGMDTLACQVVVLTFCDALAPLGFGRIGRTICVGLAGSRGLASILCKSGADRGLLLRRHADF